jgi:hypothetical protein
MKLERMPLIRDSDAGKEPESDLLKAGQLFFFSKSKNCKRTLVNRADCAQ